MIEDRNKSVPTNQIVKSDVYGITLAATMEELCIPELVTHRALFRVMPEQQLLTPHGHGTVTKDMTVAVGYEIAFARDGGVKPDVIPLNSKERWIEYQFTNDFTDEFTLFKEDQYHSHFRPDRKLMVCVWSPADKPEDGYLVTHLYPGESRVYDLEALVALRPVGMPKEVAEVMLPEEDTPMLIEVAAMWVHWLHSSNLKNLPVRSF